MKSKLSSITLTIGFFLLSSVITFTANASTPKIPITNFSEVERDIYRGARPDANGMAALVQLGVKTDLNLEDDSAAVAAESDIAQILGIQMISKPMSGFWAPSDKVVDEALAIVSNPANYPLFIHCLHGQDRTGLIVGLYRVFFEQWKAKTAYKEMKKNGFHPILVFLNHYFEERTGFED